MAGVGSSVGEEQPHRLLAHRVGMVDALGVGASVGEEQPHRLLAHEVDALGVGEEQPLRRCRPNQVLLATWVGMADDLGGVGERGT